MLVPVIGLVQVGAQAMADRYTYLPLIGRLRWRAPGGCPGRRRPAGAAGAAAAGAGAPRVGAARGAERRAGGLWRDSETLFRHALAVTADNWLIHNNLGGFARSTAGRRER